MPTNLISNKQKPTNLTINQQLSLNLVIVKMQTCRCIQPLVTFHPSHCSIGVLLSLGVAITIIFILRLFFLWSPKLTSQHITKKEKGVNYLFHNLMETLNPNQCIENLNLTRVQLSCGHILSTTNLQPNLSTSMN